MTGGGKYGWGSSCTTGEGIDTDHIGLNGVQEDLFREVKKAGKKIIYIHMDCKPISECAVTEEADAVIEYWFPGDTGGQAVADVIFGDYNPAGRLPITAARNVGQIPIYHSQKNGSGYRPLGMTIAKYSEGDSSPLYPFGYGLSYTAFEYSNLQVTSAVAADGIVEVSLDVTNIGQMDGEEVVQVYVTDELASMLRPAQELAGFKRVAVKSGEKKQVKFTMRADQFAFLDKDMNWLVEAGTMTVHVGASSSDFRLTGQFEITDSRIIDGKSRGFFAK